jgi:hypothetical protein
MTALWMALLGWVLVSYGIGALWVWGHRPRPEAELLTLPASAVKPEQLAG